jgi:hypothetical protein
MTTGTGILSAALDDERLCRTVAELLAPVLGPDVQVQYVSRQPCAFATLFPAEVLCVALEGRPGMRLFLKHLGPEQSRQPDKQRRDREVRVYEELLSDQGPEVARYYGSRWNAVTGRHEVYLEFVDAWPLKYHELEHWFTAARSLGRFHAHFATRADLLRAYSFLLPLNERYFADWGTRARAAVADRSPELAGAMTKVLAEYGPVCELLARQPQTLVHNDLAPKNVIADPSTKPARICFIDWEMAGVGCGLLDLAHLKYGLDPASDEAMVAEYRAGLRGGELLPAEEREFQRVLAACELHKTLYRLAHCEALGSTSATVGQWVADAKVFLQRASLDSSGDQRGGA